MIYCFKIIKLYSNTNVAISMRQLIWRISASLMFSLLCWRIPTDKAILNEKDTRHLLLKDFESPFTYEENLYENTF